MKSNIILSFSLILLMVYGCSKDPAPAGLSSKLSLSNQAVSSIAQNSATGEILVSGGFSGDITDKGICWSTSSNPTTDNAKISGGSGDGFISLMMTGLVPGNTYFVRGYVITRTETIYGDQQQFNTQAYQLATLSTAAVSSITQTTAASGGNVTALGGGAVSAKGVCWNNTGNPTILNSKTNDGAGLGTFSSQLSILTPGTVYYARAYATNQAGTVYGQQVSFVTISIALASVSTPAITSITQTAASFSASVTADGGGTVSAKGICWSTVANPTIANSRTIDGSGLGAFSSGVSGLNPGTTYYARAYATNQAGTAYSALYSFTTTAVQLATLSGTTVSAIAKTSATVSASVTANGGGAITNRGVCWSTSTNPTVPASSYFDNGPGTASISGSLSGLVTGTTYYLRAYAINSAGIAYGTLTSSRTL